MSEQVAFTREFLAQLDRSLGQIADCFEVGGNERMLLGNEATRPAKALRLVRDAIQEIIEKQTGAPGVAGQGLTHMMARSGGVTKLTRRQGPLAEKKE